jgi:hypothetical protein
MTGCRKRKKFFKYHRPLRRRDMLTRMLVDIAINYAGSLGIEKAAAFLRERKVPESVIARVIVDDDSYYY